MAAANTFGVTPTVLAGRVADLTISAASSPSTTDVTDIIADEAESIRGMATTRGISTDGMLSTADAYGIFKGILIYRAVAALMRARGRGDESEAWRRQANDDWKRLEERPQTVDGSASSDLVETVEQWADRTGNANGQDTWDLTGSGRIYNGGSL
tara:strand:+ start:947 stop:1411 length:465 start_codon:yes stop_codon:yes gene_type:complete